MPPSFQDLRCGPLGVTSIASHTTPGPDDRTLEVLMNRFPRNTSALRLALTLACGMAAVFALDASDLNAQSARMTFFITSSGPGDGADLGGLDGADAHCESLAYAAGAGGLGWHAYLSSTDPTVHARDRIGAGPWYNYAGDEIAANVAQLHSADANLTKESILTEKGEMVNGRGDDPNMHDILTGSNLDGTAFMGGDDYTNCDNWTSNGAGSTQVGHHDRQGGGQNPESWNSAHGSRGCGQEDLQGTGGNGFFYCFASRP